MNQHTPSWFESAIAKPYSSQQVDIDGCPIHYQSWGQQGKPGLLLVHGSGAHSHWWDFIAPLFSDHFHVVAYDLSGMGDSGHRNEYTPESYASELAELTDAVGFASKPVLLGHSFGARVVFKALQSYPHRFAGAILADAPFRPPGHEFELQKRGQQTAKPHRMYDSFAAAKSRFRLFPEQPCDNAYIVEHIAKHSIKETAGGWCWKFDPKVYSRFDYASLFAIQPTAGDKILAMIYGENSSLYIEKTRVYNEELFESLGLPAPIPLAHAHHHLLLDQPLAFVDTVKDVLRRHAFMV